MFRHIGLEKVDRIPNLAGTEHRIDCGQNYSGNGNDCLFLAPSFGDALIPQSVVRVILVFHLSVWGLNQGKLKVNTGSGSAERLLLPADSLLPLF